jgi:hypothetical protein
MSRGPGKLQLAVWGILLHHRRPMTFAEIRGARLSASLERSSRRAIQRMTEDGVLIVTGSGRPSDPYRYAPHPGLLAMMGPTVSASADRSG